MPEGDSIRKAVHLIQGGLVQQPVERLFVRDRGFVSALRGQTIEGVEAIGKHMLIRIAGGWTLRIHLGMYGRCRMLNHAISKPSMHCSAMVETPLARVGWFRAMHAELVRTRDLRLQRRLDRLGPDLLADQVDYEDILRRGRGLAGTRTIAELLLDQRVAAGIGNVYRSEVLFVMGIFPFALALELESQWMELFQRAAELMKANLIPGLRTTTTPRTTGIRRSPQQARHWVYRRSGLPCLRCNAPIQRKTIGDLERSVYWCPECQAQSMHQGDSGRD